MYPYLKVLFVCKDEVIKSLIALSYYNGFAHHPYSIIVRVSDNSILDYKEVNPDIIQIMKEEKIDFIISEINPISEEKVKNVDRVIVFCKKEDCPDFLLKHPSIYFWEIENPQNVSMNELRKIIEKIKLKVFDLFRIRW